MSWWALALSSQCSLRLDRERHHHQVTGSTPTEVHIHTSCLKPSDVPMDSEEHASKWMLARFAAKEQQLVQFYDKGSFSGGKVRRLQSHLVYLSFAYFIGLFGVLCWWAMTARLLLLLVLLAYFGTFYALNASCGGFDRLLLQRAGFTSSK